MSKTLMLLSIFALACEPGTGPGKTPVAGETASLSGRARSEGEPAEGATVTAYRVNADGSLQAESAEPATTDAEGRYTLSLEATGESAAELLVLVQLPDGGEASGIVSANLEAGAEQTVAPIDEQSTAEAGMFVSLRASGAWDEGSMHMAQLRAVVDAGLSAAWAESSEASRQVAAESAAAAMAAWTLSAKAVDEGRASAAASAHAAAMAALDARAAAGEELSDAATLDAMLSAWQESGFTSEDLAYFAHAAAGAQASTASDDACGRASAALFASLWVSLSTEVIDGAGEDGFGEPFGGTEALEAALVGGSGGSVELAVRDAWEAYAAGVWLELVAAADVTAAVALSEARDGAAAAGAALEAALESASGAPDEVGAACAGATAEFRAAAAASASLSGAMGASEAAAAASILAQLEAGAAH